MRWAALVSGGEPNYPDAAKKARLQGAVWLDVVIGGDGHVASTQPISGNPVLVKAAEDDAMDLSAHLAERTAAGSGDQRLRAFRLRPSKHTRHALLPRAVSARAFEILPGNRHQGETFESCTNELYN
jgi:hypothetical protein